MEKDIIEIINTKKGKIDLGFWSKIIMETKIKEKKINPCKITYKLDFDEIEKIYIPFFCINYFNNIFFHIFNIKIIFR